MKLIITNHAVMRYAERCKGINDLDPVERTRFETEIYAFAERFGVLCDAAPGWFGLPPEESDAQRATHFICIGDDVVLPIYQKGSCWVAVTCITRGCISDVVRRARNEARQDRAKRTAHKRRMKAHHKMPRSDSQQ